MWFDVVTSVEMWCLPYKVLLRDTLTSSTLCIATCGMQRAMELRHSCLIIATREKVQYNARSNRSHCRSHQILCLPLKMTFMIDPRHIWNVICNARSNRCHPPTSPNTVHARQNDSHAWSSSPMKRHWQCAGQEVSPSNVTKYCACHAKWPPKMWEKLAQNSWINVISNARPIRDRSETVPSMNPSVRNPPRNRASPSTAPTTKSDTWPSINWLY